MTKYIYNIGDFSFVTDNLERMVYEDAWKTINTLDINYINYIKNKNINESWMFTTDKNALYIMNNLEMKDYHSGASMALTMRAMEHIIKFGWDSFVQNYK